MDLPDWIDRLYAEKRALEHEGYRVTGFLLGRRQWAEVERLCAESRWGGEDAGAAEGVSARLWGELVRRAAVDDCAVPITGDIVTLTEAAR